MRKIISLNENWQFGKGASLYPECPPIELVTVKLPHTWNAEDGQDGGNDYYRDACLYKRELEKKELPSADRYYIEIQGANSSADLYIDQKRLAHHDGGYSAWRVDITDALKEKCELAIVVDNSANDRVYPQTADFTFYGGLYRNVNLIAVNETHFDLDYFGGCGFMVTPIVNGTSANITLEAFAKGLRAGDELVFTVNDASGAEVKKIRTLTLKTAFDMSAPHLWHGKKNPYLYTAKAEIVRGGKVLDEVSTRFGIRSFRADPERGFILNGEEYPLRGVSRHQDRLGVGNALLPEHHREDIGYILDMGATTVRLAHYQHDQYFYELCDECGLVVWAEIPYISQHMPTGRENTVSQMRELVIQNYNHPSIVAWGLSNEITMKGADDPDLIENHRILNDLVKELDKMRLTTIACISMCDINAQYIKIPDAVSYNHYFGWYGGDTSMNGPWLDKFHAVHPNIPIGVSEYGCEALNWHTSNPIQGDYTEEYQAYYHEELIKQLFTRKYLWATHVWNMFDFGADARAEGGENGQNHKGLMTMDRSYKKDAFYAYKAWLSDEPFVHICGKRYVERVEDVTKVTVYSNQPEVELFVNGKGLGKKSAPDHFFYFDVPNSGESTLVAKAGELSDESKLRKVDKMNDDYILKEKGTVLNWFDVEAPEGRFSLNDKIGDITSTALGKLWFLKFGMKIKKATKGTDGKKSAAGFDVTPELMQMMNGFTVLRMTGMMSMMNVSFTKEELLKMNKQLNRIKKPKGAK